jgi:hypothetical protein
VNFAGRIRECGARGRSLPASTVERTEIVKILSQGVRMSGKLTILEVEKYCPQKSQTRK